MTKIEKGILTIVIIGFLTLGGTMWYLIQAANEAGGFKQLIIEAGKEVKDIAREIEKH